MNTTHSEELADGREQVNNIDINNNKQYDNDLQNSTLSPEEQETMADPRVCLSSLSECINRPMPPKPSAHYIMAEAQQLVDAVNRKRANDTQLLEEFRMALDMQTKMLVQSIEEKLYMTYQQESVLVDKKLQELFTHLGNIETAEGELKTFKQSLKKLYQEMQTAD